MAKSKASGKPPRTPKSRKAIVQAAVQSEEVIPFFHLLWGFYNENRSSIRKLYSKGSRDFLDYNDKNRRHDAFLRTPQFEALEMYVFLKEGLNNAHMAVIFDDWWQHRGVFEHRSATGLTAIDEQAALFDIMPDKRLGATLSALRQSGRDYSNYIFALTMGTGKTILMATCIFYEFVMARLAPNDPRYCHNALVIAPDTTVLQSLREIMTFDRSLVIPAVYRAALESSITFHYMADADTLNVLHGSEYNVVIANAQKIILKKSNTKGGAANRLFKAEKSTYTPRTAFDRLLKKLELDNPENEVEIVASQRFRKLLSLDRLGIYVDEAHHAFGQVLARDVGAETNTRATSLRETITELAAQRKEGGSPVVACYNYTGTPYYSKGVFPEVVYAYNLKDAIHHQYLKRAKFYGYENVKSEEFVKLVIEDFLKQYKGKRFEGMLPKLAFFASSIDELESELRPAVENVLAKHGVSLNKILVNTEKATNDDIREFINLDTSESNKQFILLINKGKEGWNCRSLFGVAMYRNPKSKIFVLQAAMRCLRSIEPQQQMGHIYLSEENVQILENELQQNFRTSTEELGAIGKKRKLYNVELMPPPREIKLNRVRRMFNLKESEPKPGTALGVESVDRSLYDPKVRISEGTLTDPQKAWLVEEISLLRLLEQIRYTPITLCAELARYLRRSPIEIENFLELSKEGMDKVLELVNTYNATLYCELIPKLFNIFYTVEQFNKPETETITLVEVPKVGNSYQVSGDPDKVVMFNEVAEDLQQRTLHVAPYIFDSQPELDFYREALHLVQEGLFKEVYFMGMLTHGQTRFFLQYVDPDTEALRSYYPDFLLRKKDDSWIIVEVKADFMLDDAIVRAKGEVARQMAESNRFRYCMIPSTQVQRESVREKLLE